MSSCGSKLLKIGNLEEHEESCQLQKTVLLTQDMLPETVRLSRRPDLQFFALPLT
jgi:hypothetical protein